MDRPVGDCRVSSCPGVDPSDVRQLFEAVIETAPTPIVMTDPIGRILLFNRTAEQLTGYTRAEVMTKPLTELFVPPEWTERVMERLCHPDPGVLGVAHEYPWQSKSGRLLHIEWRCALVRCAPYEQPCLMSIGVDVTERNAAEAKMQSLVQQLQQKVNELEQFEQVVVGRELKMIELEREVQTLRRRLSGRAAPASHSDA